MFYLVGIVLTFFLVRLLVTKRGKAKEGQIFVIGLIFIGVHLFFFYLYITDKAYSFSYYYLLVLHFPFPLVHGPFLCLYTGTSTDQLERKLQCACLSKVIG
jgi:peptidoglycan/LPS O-acetylase OafA/YrhL